MGRFVVRASPYPRHERIREFRATGVRHIWIATVEPRAKPFTRPVAERRLAHAGFVVRIPAERPSHVDGTPRESFVPCRLDTRATDADDDPERDAVVRVMATGVTPASRCAR